MSIVQSYLSTLVMRIAPESFRKKQIDKRFRRIVDYARTHSPAIAELYKDVDPQNYKLSDLPPCTKQMVMQNYDNWVTDRAVKLEDLKRFTADPDNIGRRYLDKYLVCKTSGTTSVPLIMLHDQNFLNNTSAESLFLHVMKYKPFAFCHLSDLFVIPICTIKDNIRRFPFLKKNFRMVNAGASTEEIDRQLNEIQPKTLFIQPSNIDILLEEARAGRLKIHPKEVVCYSEMLPDRMRQTIHDVFRCTVKSIYGCTEIGNMAVECGHSRPHLDSDWNIVEFVDDNYQPVPPGTKSAKILVTNLSDRILPLIRYEVSDSLVYHPGDRSCPCGSRAPWIEIEGRETRTYVSLMRRGELVPVLIYVPYYAATCDVYGLYRLQFFIHGHSQIEFRAIFNDGTDTEAAVGKIRSLIEDCLKKNEIEGCSVVYSTESPIIDPVSHKFRPFYILSE